MYPGHLPFKVEDLPEHLIDLKRPPKSLKQRRNEIRFAFQKGLGKIQLKIISPFQGHQCDEWLSRILLEYINATKQRAYCNSHLLPSVHQPSKVCVCWFPFQYPIGLFFHADLAAAEGFLTANIIQNDCEILICLTATRVSGHFLAFIRARRQSPTLNVRLRATAMAALQIDQVVETGVHLGTQMGVRTGTRSQIIPQDKSSMSNTEGHRRRGKRARVLAGEGWTKRQRGPFKGIQ